MSSWAERVHRRAADLSSVVTLCGHPGSSATAYPYRLEKVKFGVLFEDVCKNNDNIPGPLLVLILKLNKESPNRRDVFRAPGHQGAMKKLIHFLQAGRLVNVDNYSVYTIASVLKKFLRKIPYGIFGRNGEKELFEIIELENETEQTERLHRLFTSLPKYTQHLLVLLFGTFRVIASNAVHAGTGMTSEAIGVSVAPSFFQSCVSDGKTARMEDVLKFKVATKIVKHVIDRFAINDIFGRENYEYYARVTGRILKVQDEWICSFQYPPPPREKLAQQKYALQHSLEAEKTWLQCQCERWGSLAQEESRSTPALLTSSSSALDNSVISLGLTPEHSLFESCARLSVSLEGPGLFVLTSSPVSKTSKHGSMYGGFTNYVDADADGDADADDDDDEIDFASDMDNSNADVLDSHGIKTNNHKYAMCTKKKSKKVRNANAIANANAAASALNASLEQFDYIDKCCEAGEMSAVKRRYRQNKKKIPQRLQYQRRVRVSSKSLDGCEHNATTSDSNTNINNINVDSKIVNIKSNILTTKPGSNCSRCYCGLRYSSFCSSRTPNTEKTANVNANVSAKSDEITMKELRTINHYAWSAKSLSYLPQVRDEYLLASRISV